MKQSQLFTKTIKDNPKDEVSTNARLLIRGGFIHKEMAGVYSFLPLGLRVLEKIQNIIREEMDAIGGQELFLTALQNAEIWKKTNRWSDEVIDVWFKTKFKNGVEAGLGATHEEEITNLMKTYVSSYKNLPIYAYQFQTKFRNEIRSRSGIIRTREFIMKDLYSFCRDEKELDEFYQKCTQSYLKIFQKVGLGEKTYITFASGGAFSKYSHEFQTVSDSGEDTIYVDEEKRIAINKEVYNDEVIKDLGLEKKKLAEKKSIEVGNIFKLGTRFSEALGLSYLDEKGEKKPVVMGSYGIGPARVMGTIVEIYNDEKGIIWPESVAPFKIHLLSLREDEKAQEVYEFLQKNNIEVLFDDRDLSAGEKFSEADLLGIPYRILVSEKSLEKGGYEVKKRNEKESRIFTLSQLLDFLG